MTKYRKLSIISLAFVVAAALLAAISLLGGVFSADAERNISLTGSNYFYTANQAEINDYCTDESEQVYYVSFVFADDDSAVTYRKNLAYNWFSSASDEDGNATNKGQEGFLNTEIGFDSLTFETFTIKFQSQQYTKTSDGVTSNYITFVADVENDCVYAVIGSEPYEYEEADKADVLAALAEDYEALSYEKITISFTSYVSGVYSVEITDGENTQYGEFVNVGGTYARYVSSSSSTSVIPLTYSAKFAEGHADVATMILYSFNGQSFELSGDSDDRTITDDTPPVLCLAQDVNTLRYGRSIDISYAVVDMLATSPRATLSYYVLKTSQIDSGVDLNSTEDGLFTEVSGSDVSPVIRDGNDCYSVTDDGDLGYTTECLVKICYTLKDSTATGGTSDIVFLEWYVPSEYLYSVTSDDETYSFIRATTDKQGASYNGTVEEIQSGYQALVDEALEEQGASAGDGNYFYLPSFENYIKDNVTGYRDLTFSIYYISGSSGSYTSLDYNELAIELDSDGLYRFVIYATDVTGNKMYYLDEDGTAVEFEASELSDLLSDPKNSSLLGYVPIFEFNVNYGGLSVTTPSGQDIGFVGTQYSASSFEITGLSSNYTTTYTLYLFDRQAYTDDYGPISYADFISIVEDLFNDAESRAKYFTTIKALSDMEETDEDYDLYADYEWDPDNLTFVPQDDNSFYVIRLEAVDKTYQTASIVSYMAISASAAAASLPGENDWLKNNVASVVLLCIAGAALIGIVLLIVIKPKEKGDIDIIDENESKKGSARKKVSRTSKK